jgi:hypothetical protein
VSIYDRFLCAYKQQNNTVVLLTNDNTESMVQRGIFTVQNQRNFPEERRAEPNAGSDEKM